MVGLVRGGGANRLSPTGPFAESPKVSATLAELHKRANDGGASSIMFLPAQGVRYDAFAFAYHTGLAKEMNIPVAPKGPLRGTICINASGHATGALLDRVAGWAEQKLPVGTDAVKLEALRGACEKAVAKMLDGAASTVIEVGGKKLELSRATFEQAQDQEQFAELGNDALRKHFAATNTYNVRIRMPDGQVTEQRGLPRNNADRIEFATRIAIELPAGTTGTVTLEAWPTGSAEVKSYLEARRYRIHIGAEQFSVAGAIENAEKYQAAHPEVRWDTEHEEEDLEATETAPSPYPYQDF